MLCQGMGEHNCATPNKYLSIFTQDNTITISTVGSPASSLTASIEEDIINELSPDELWRQEMQRKLTSTERHYTAPAEDANSSYDKVDNLQNYFDC